MFLRISAAAIATDRNSPSAAPRPPGRTMSPISLAIRAESSASCPRLKHVRTSYRNGSSMKSLFRHCGLHGRSRSFIQVMTRISTVISCNAETSWKRC